MNRQPGVDTYSHSYYARGELALDQVRLEAQTVTREVAVHAHDDIELLYVRRGTGTLLVNGLRLPLRTGALARLFPFHLHGVTAEPGQTLELLLCAFPLSVLLYLDVNKRFEAVSYSVLEYRSPVVQLEPYAAQQVTDTLSHMLEELQGERLYYQNMLLSGLLRVVALFERESAAHLDFTAAEQRSTAWKALQYIHLHFNAELDAASVAELFDTDPLRLGHMLRMLTGRGFSENLHEVRIRNACAMMRFQELTISYIARYVGYKSPATFYRAFHRLKGVAPEQYRAGATDNPAPGGRRDTAWQILVYLLEHYSEDLNPSLVADRLFMGQGTMTGILRANFGMGFSALLEQIRLRYACALLGATGLQVYDIAIAVGFNSVRTFSRCFRECMGTSPSAYRRSLPEFETQP